MKNLPSDDIDASQTPKPAPKKVLRSPDVILDDLCRSTERYTRREFLCKIRRVVAGPLTDLTVVLDWLDIVELDYFRQEPEKAIEFCVQLFRWPPQEVIGNANVCFKVWDGHENAKLPCNVELLRISKILIKVCKAMGNLCPFDCQSMDIGRIFKLFRCEEVSLSDVADTILALSNSAYFQGGEGDWDLFCFYVLGWRLDEAESRLQKCRDILEERERDQQNPNNRRRSYSPEELERLFIGRKKLNAHKKKEVWPILIQFWLSHRTGPQLMVPYVPSKSLGPSWPLEAL